MPWVVSEHRKCSLSSSWADEWQLSGSEGSKVGSNGGLNSGECILIYLELTARIEIKCILESDQFILGMEIWTETLNRKERYGTCKF